MTDQTTTPATPETPPPDPTPDPAPVPAAAEPSVLTAGAPVADSPAPETPAPAEIAYGDFTLPEGATLDAAALDLFREARLPQEAAQKFIDLAVSREQAATARGVQAFVDLQTKWVSEIKADPEIGGERFRASVALAGRAIDRLGVPGLREALDLTGAGNNPAIVKAFVRLGQMVSEDRFAPGREARPAAPRSPAEVIYGTAPQPASFPGDSQ